MNGEIYDDLAIEQIGKNSFGLAFDIDHVVLRGIPVGPTVSATIFLTTKKQLMAYISGEKRLTLGDVGKIIARMGLVSELYFPPKGQPHYFDKIGESKYREVFPGLKNPSHEDIRYYRTLAPYNPALVQILEVKNGEIKQYDRDSRDGWRIAKKFAYRRIRTS